MTSVSPIPTDEQTRITVNGRSRLWLASWLARRPDVMARLVRTYHRLRRRSLAQRRRLARGAAVTLAGAALLLALSSVPAAEEAITVANGEVAIVANGKCSLIEAIDNANNTKNGRPHQDCAAGNPKGADVINLPANGEFVLRETAVTGDAGPSGTPWITSAVTINGNGSTIRRAEDAPEFRLMQVGKKGDLTVRELTLSNGQITNNLYGGGALLNQGTVLLVQSLISYSSTNYEYVCGGGIHNVGLMTIERSSIYRNYGYGCGGGILNSGEMTILSSDVSYNEAYSADWGTSGGGVSNEGVMSITNSTISHNTAWSHRGAGGGGLSNQGSLKIIDSIVSENSAGGSDGVGGGIDNFGTLEMSGTTLQSNGAGGTYGASGGGLFNSKEADIKFSVITGNRVVSGDPRYQYLFTTSGGGIGNFESVRNCV
jgi:hypothetical protein